MDRRRWAASRRRGSEPRLAPERVEPPRRDCAAGVRPEQPVEAGRRCGAAPRGRWPARADASREHGRAQDAVATRGYPACAHSCARRGGGGRPRPAAAAQSAGNPRSTARQHDLLRQPPGDSGVVSYETRADRRVTVVNGSIPGTCARRAARGRRSRSGRALSRIASYDAPGLSAQDIERFAARRCQKSGIVRAVRLARQELRRPLP